MPVVSGARVSFAVSPAVTRSGYRLVVVLVAAVLLGQVHPKHRPALVCPLRAVTGIPCPFCGGTTAAAHVGRADLLAAVRASPLAVVGAPVVAVWPVLRRQLARVPRRAQVAALAVGVAGSELWQLHRLGWI